VGVLKTLPMEVNLGITYNLIIDSQTVHAKLGSQDGNSREHESRSPMIIK